MARVPADPAVADLRHDAVVALKRAHLSRLLANGDREIAADKGYNLDTVLSDADELLARK
jgi:hypothetical protein